MTDANLLIFAYAPASPFHLRAKTWLEEQLSSGSELGMPWASLLAFVRIISNPRITTPAMPLPEAWRAVEAMLAASGVWIPGPGPRHQQILAKLFQTSGLNNNSVPDAHLAALAIEHDLVLCTADNDFKVYPGLRYVNPLEPVAPPQVH